MTERISLSTNAPENWQDAIDRAVGLLRSGGAVAFPTDTVYGLGVDPFNLSAMEELYRLKGRPEQKPIALLVSGADDLKPLTPTLTPFTDLLIEHFWPGPLTLVLTASPELPKAVRSEFGTVGVRMPDHPVALELIRAFGGPLAVTSANRSGEPDLLTGEEVEAVFRHELPLILDGGRTPGGTPSTVLDLSQSAPRLLRSGPVSREALVEILETDIH